ncbi:MAG: urease accessory protein [Gaiellaceae bacterium]|jgi:urease accessory protein|nr:urease accessory protein [Gaiellaceae bacterium]
MSVSLLLLTDGRFPAGGYAHSGGLEAAVEAGLGLEGVPLFLAGRLQGVAASEARLAVAAARAARREDLDALLLLDREAEARCPSPPLRAAARRLGAQLLRSAVTVWPDAELLERYREASAGTPRPIAFGAVAASAGLDDEELARALLYEDAATVTGAAVRLLPVDSAATARWLVEATPRIERLAREAAAQMLAPEQLPAGFAPMLELRSLAHAAREGKLFAS